RECHIAEIFYVTKCTSLALFTKDNLCGTRGQKEAVLIMANTPWAILLCKFNDDLSEPFSKAFAEQLFTAAGKGTLNMVDFFVDVSHGSVDLSDSKVFGWLTLPHPHTDYVGSGANPAGRSDLLNWGRQAAASSGINLNGFFNIVVVLNVGTDLFGSRDGVV